MAYQPINRSQIVQALQEFGPMTRYELAEHLGWTVEKVGTTISSTRHLKPGQVFRIVGYEQGVRVVAVFAAEAGEDKSPPQIDKTQRKKLKNARWREKNLAVISTKGRIANAARDGLPVAVNPWITLAPPTIRATMSRIHREESGARYATP